MSRRTIVPMMPVHLPHLSSMSDRPTMAHTTRMPTTIDGSVPIGFFRKKVLIVVTTAAASVPPIHTGLLIQ